MGSLVQGLQNLSSNYNFEIFYSTSVSYNRLVVYFQRLPFPLNIFCFDTLRAETRLDIFCSLIINR